MEQYINKSKVLIDHLLAARIESYDRKQVLYAFGGLDSNYMSLVTNITLRKECLD